MQESIHPPLLITHWEAKQTDRAEQLQLAERILPLVRLSFETFDSSENDLLNSFDNGEDLTIATTEAGEDAGFLFAKLHQAPFGELTWVHKIAVNRAVQGRGVGSQLLAKAALTGWIGCTTQNPSLIRLFERHSELLWPIHMGYQTDDFSRGLLKYAREEITICKAANDDGVIAGLYNERLGAYPERTDVPHITNALRNVGVDADHGDAAVIVGVA